MTDKIIIKGARTHNLKNIDLEIPKNSITVITGISGSGKSSLAFDTIYAEGQRKYVESLSPYARQFLELMDKPDVDYIEGLSPAISIEQKTSGHNPRSTVGTVTEIYDYLRLLFARVGHPRSIISGRRLIKQTVQQITDDILSYPDILNIEDLKIMIISPLVKSRKGTYEDLFKRLLSQGYQKVRVNNQMYSLEEEIKLDKYQKHNIDLIVDRLIINKDKKNDKDFLKRLVDSIELALQLGEGEILVNIVDMNEIVIEKLKEKGLKQNGDIFYSEKLVDPDSGTSFPDIEPHSFSFNSPYGACQNCKGLGFVKEVDLSNIYNPRLSVLEGGIYPWTKVIENPNSITYKILKLVAKEEGIDLSKPIKDLSEKEMNILLYGSGDKKYKLQILEDQIWQVGFDGVINQIQKKYSESDSEIVRSEYEMYMIEKKCPECKGYRLRKESLGVTISGMSIVDVTKLSINEALEWISKISKGKAFENKNLSVINEVINSSIKIDPKNDTLTIQEREIAKQIFKEIQTRLEFLLSVGLDYLTLDRSAQTLSGGESQRIRLASQIGTGLSGVIYVLDEPSIGLHQRDNEKLLQTLKKLKELGNTVIVVEHDEDTIKEADYIIDMGPGAGELGGRIIAQGKVQDIINSKESITGKYLSCEYKIDKEEIYDLIKQKLNNQKYKFNNLNKDKNKKLIIRGITHNNLKGIDFELPLGKFVAVTGVSGSGKSSLINDVLYKILAQKIYGSKEVPGSYNECIGTEYIDKVINVDQSPIGRTPRSNPATYVGIFGEIRELFANTKEAKSRGYKPGRFSFNVKGGRCEKCEGGGLIKISMQFLPDVYVKCDACEGKRYNRETLQIDYKDKNIYDVLEMTVEEACKFFENIQSIQSKLKTLVDVGLGYIKLGQSATTLSGGESQRIKLATELSKKQTGNTIYILDEPTTGLHFDDIKKLLLVLHSLVYFGNTVVVIEHNLDVIKTADWIIDLGPEGGDKGGYIIAEGEPKDIINAKESYTAQWLKRII